MYLVSIRSAMRDWRKPAALARPRSASCSWAGLPITDIAFAAGFASGNIVGVWLEEKIAIGSLVVRIITSRENGILLARLRASGFAVTNIDAEGEGGQVDLLFTIVRRKELPKLTSLIRQYNPAATYTVEDVRFASSSVVSLATAKRPFALRRPHILRT